MAGDATAKPTPVDPKEYTEMMEMAKKTREAHPDSPLGRLRDTIREVFGVKALRSQK